MKKILYLILLFLGVSLSSEKNKDEINQVALPNGCYKIEGHSTNDPLVDDGLLMVAGAIRLKIAADIGGYVKKDCWTDWKIYYL